jgi:hypothetical protein
MLRVSFIHTLRARLSRRSGISMGDLLGWDGTTSSLVFGLRRLRGFLRLVTWAYLGLTVTLGAAFSVLLFLLTFVTSLRVGISATARGNVEDR